MGGSFDDVVSGQDGIESKNKKIGFHEPPLEKALEFRFDDMHLKARTVKLSLRLTYHYNS